MQTSNTRHPNRLRLLAAAATLAGTLAIAPALEAQAPSRDSARAEQGMRRGPRGDRMQRMNPAQRVDRQVAHLTERLSLSEQQATQIRRILTQEHEQMTLVMEQAGMQRPDSARARDGRSARPSEAEREAMRARMQVVRTQMDAVRAQTAQRVEAVLTAEQRETWRTLRDQRPAGRGPHAAHGPPHGGR